MNENSNLTADGIAIRVPFDMWQKGDPIRVHLRVSPKIGAAVIPRGLNTLSSSATDSILGDQNVVRKGSPAVFTGHLITLCVANRTVSFTCPREGNPMYATSRVIDAAPPAVFLSHKRPCDALVAAMTVLVSHHHRREFSG